MNQENLRRAAEVMRAAAEGNRIQFLDVHSEKPKWRHVSFPTWDWSEYDYRVEPAAEPFPDIWSFVDALSKHSGNRLLNTALGDKVQVSNVDAEDNSVRVITYPIVDGDETGVWITLGNLAKTFTFEDGTPCAVIESNDPF